MSEQLKETKEALKFAFTLASAIETSMEDGKITLGDLTSFFSVFNKLGPALEGIGSVPLELKSLDAAVAADLLAYIDEEFDLQNDAAEQAIEKGLSLVAQLAALVGLLK